MARPPFITPETRRYVDQRLPRLLNESGIPEIVIPDNGVNSECYLVRFPSGIRYVLRVFQIPRQHAAYHTVMLLAEHHGLPMPRLVASDHSLLVRLRFSRAFLVEEFADGLLLNTAGVSEQTMQPVLDSLATLHDVRMKRWGYPRNLKTGSYRNQCLGRVERILDGIPARNDFLSPGDLDKWAGFVRLQWRNLPEPDDFCPVHHHLAPDDIILSPDGKRATFLDNGALRYGHFAHDLEDVLAWGAMDDPQRREHLKRAYFKRRKTLPIDYEYGPIEPFFRAEHALKKIRSALRKLDRGDATQSDLIEQHAARLRSLVREG